MQIKNEIITIINKALVELDISSTTEIVLEHPADATHGDYATNIAMQLFSQLKKSQQQTTYKNPRELAKTLTASIQKNLQPNSIIASVSVAGPGFVNFTLSNGYLLDQMTHLKKAPLAQVKLKQPKTAVIEYVSPNTNKPLHIGHLRNAVLGISLINILEETGWNVYKATINNNRGLHIIKSMWAYLFFGKKPLVEQDSVDLTDADWEKLLETWIKSPQNWVQPEEMTEKKLQKPDYFVGFWYVKADALAEEKKVQDMWQQMLVAWEQQDDLHHQQVRKLWEQLNNWFYQGYQQTRERVGFAFDPEHVSYESDIFEAGKQIVLASAKKGIFKTLENGAVQAELEEKYRLPNKVLLRGDGTGIYMTFDIELTKQRSKLNADELIWIVGSDQKLYFQQLFAVAELLGFGKRENFRHFGYGMVRLPEGKMSSRKGRVVYTDDILDQAVDRAKKIMKETGAAKNFTSSELLKTAEIVGLGAVKWSLLSQDPLSNMTFDVDTSVSFTGFAGPYVQYTAVRCQSVLAKNKPGEIAFSKEITLEPEEKAVLRQLYQYPEVVAKAATEYAPHTLCAYLFDLAREYSAFYNQHQILIEDKPQIQDFRLQLTETVLTILASGLNLLGIQLPQRM